MLRSRPMVLSAALCAAALSAAFRASAAPEEVSTAVRQMLQVGWETSLDARRQVESLYTNLSREHTADDHLEYAYTLVLLKHRRYSDAAKLVDQLANRHPRWWLIRSTQVWLTTLTRDYETALAQMRQLAADLPEPQDDSSIERGYQQIAEQLGALCAYMSGPALGAVEEARLLRTEQQIQDALGPTRALAFDQGRKALLQRYLGKAENVDQNMAEAEKKAEVEKQQAIEQSQRQVEQATEAVTSAQSQFEEVKKEIGYELDDIGRQLAELTAQAQRVQVDAAAERREVTLADGQVAQLLALADVEEDDFRRRHLLNDAARWRLHRDRHAVRLAELDRTYAALSAQAGALQQRRAALQNRLQQEAQVVGRAQKGLVRSRRQEQDAREQSISGNTPAVRDMKRRSTALTTYVPAPLELEQEKQRLLDSLNQ